MAELPRVPVHPSTAGQPLLLSVQLCLVINEEREVAQCSLPVLPAAEAVSATQHTHVIVCLSPSTASSESSFHFPLLFSYWRQLLRLTSTLTPGRFAI